MSLAILNMSWATAGSLFDAALYIVLWIAMELAPTVGFFFAVYLLFSLPLRRKERARLFLDLTGLALTQGRPLEQALVSLSNSRDPAMGIRFHQLGAQLENGLPLDRALENVPRLLPPRIQGIVKVGLETGDLGRVLPACRQALGDATSETRSAINYLVVLAFVVTPTTALVPWILLVFVVPKFVEVLQGMVPGTPVPVPFHVLVAAQPWITVTVFTLIGLLWCAAICYMGGPRLTDWVQTAGPRIFDRLQLLVPWKRKRLLRDFSSVLTALLDSGMAEGEALRLAAQSSANELFQRRADQAVKCLREGQSLIQVLPLLDASGEFHWRLRNAVHGQTGFQASLGGWHESLDAQAARQEQAASQLFTTSLVLLNGALVALVILSIFGALIAIIEGGLLW